MNLQLELETFIGVHHFPYLFPRIRFTVHNDNRQLVQSTRIYSSNQLIMNHRVIHLSIWKSPFLDIGNAYPLLYFVNQFLQELILVTIQFAMDRKLITLRYILFCPEKYPHWVQLLLNQKRTLYAFAIFDRQLFDFIFNFDAQLYRKHMVITINA